MLISCGERAWLQSSLRTTLLQCRGFSEQSRRKRGFPSPLAHRDTAKTWDRSRRWPISESPRGPLPQRRNSSTSRVPSENVRRRPDLSAKPVQTPSQAPPSYDAAKQREADEDRRLDILEQSLPFEGSTSAYDSPFFRRRTGSLSEAVAGNTRSSRQTTLTELERETFERLFNSLRELPATGKKNKGRTTEAASNDAQKKKGQKNEVDKGLEDEENIVRFPTDEIHDAGTDQAELDGYIHTATSVDSPNTLSSYPAELQGMAAKAQMQMARDRHRSRLQRQGAGQVSENGFSKQEKAWRSIEHKLYHARTDGAIWEVIKWEIFARLKVIHEEASATAHKAEESANNNNANTTTTTTTTTTSTSNRKATSKTNDKPRSRAEKLTPIPLSGYAPLMLLALKLLTRRASYTALAASLPFLMRSHSRTAYVLCASTALYNELIEHTFRLQHSVPVVLALLREMREAALAGDGQTLIALDEVTRYRRNALQGDYGEAVKALEGMQGKEGEWRELLEWKDGVRGEIERRAVEGARRAEAERRMRQQGVLEDEEEEEEEQMAAAAAG
ncbi:MAG: hypothetical protein M1828_003244 [Chrysothrix sp. TS-e1954]|nr:MAG: hypothetical protein M1828_003244 [Chrysothrix sp. TS-e1954]